jgi:hypothetical protein
MRRFPVACDGRRPDSRQQSSAVFIVLRTFRSEGPWRKGGLIKSMSLVELHGTRSPEYVSPRHQARTRPIGVVPAAKRRHHKAWGANPRLPAAALPSPSIQFFLRAPEGGDIARCRGLFSRRDDTPSVRLIVPDGTMSPPFGGSELFGPAAFLAFAPGSTMPPVPGSEIGAIAVNEIGRNTRPSGPDFSSPQRKGPEAGPGRHPACRAARACLTVGAFDSLYWSDRVKGCRATQLNQCLGIAQAVRQSRCRRRR